MHQLLNLTESAETFTRLGQGGELSLKTAEGGEFSRVMLEQQHSDTALRQLAADIEAHQSGDKPIQNDLGDPEKVGEPVTRNLWDLLQQMRQETADVTTDEASDPEAELASDDAEIRLGDNLPELSDTEASALLQAMMAELASAEKAEGQTEAERQEIAEQWLADMSDSDKQALLAQFEQVMQKIAAGDRPDGAIDEIQKFIVNLLEPMVPQKTITSLLDKRHALEQALTQATTKVLNQSGSATQQARELSQLLQQLEQQVTQQQAKGDNSELTSADLKKLEQFSAELRKLLNSASNDGEKPTALSKEQSVRAEQLLNDVKQVLKGRPVSSNKASEAVITATADNVGKEKADADSAAKAQTASLMTDKTHTAQNPTDTGRASADVMTQTMTASSQPDTLTDSSVARAIQGQMVSTSQGSVAANESSQANTLQALQRPLDLQQTEASQKLQERIHIMMSRNIQRADIRLDPPELGSVNIRVHMTGEQASVQFHVQNQQARDAVEATMPRLREMLDQQGINLADTHVGEQQSQSESHGQGQSGAGGNGDNWSVEGEVALEQGRVMSDGQVDFYV